MILFERAYLNASLASLMLKHYCATVGWQLATKDNVTCVLLFRLVAIRVVVAPSDYTWNVISRTCTTINSSFALPPKHANEHTHTHTHNYTPCRIHCYLLTITWATHHHRSCEYTSSSTYYKVHK